MRNIALPRLEYSRRLLEPLLIAVAVVAALGGGVITAAVHPAAGIVVLIGAMLVAGVLLNAQLGLMSVILVITIIPFGVMPVPLLGTLKPTFLDAAMTGLLLAWVFRFLGKPATGLVRTPLDPLILLFLGLAVMSFTLGVLSVTAEATRFFLKTVNSILFFFSVTNCVRREKELTGVIRLLIFAAFAASLIAVVLYALSQDTANRLLNYLVPLGYPGGMVLRFIASTDTQRAIGTSADPNILGGMLVLVMPLALSQLFGERPLFQRWQGVVLLAVMGLAMVLTFSRGSWLGLLAAAILMSGLRYRKLMVVLVIAAAALFFLPMGDVSSVVLERVQTGMTLEDQASAMRLGEYKDAMRLISMYPWFGVGFGEAPSIDLYVGASSIYLLMAEEMGLVGVAAFMMIVSALFVRGFKAIPRIASPPLRNIQMGALAGVLGALVAGLFDHHFFNLDFPHTVALFWLMVGLVEVSTRLGIRPVEEG